MSGIDAGQPCSADFEGVEDAPDDEMGEQDSGDSSGEDSDDESVAAAEILAVETELLANPYKYDQHILIIDILKKSGDLEKLRNARQRMSELFPLTEVLWLDWLRDETRIAVTEEEKEQLVLLFERAVKDYLSVPLWLEYAQFAIGQMGKEGGILKCRDVMERALVAAGLHVVNGSVLWEVYREFESAILCTKQHAGGQELSPVEQEEESRQKARVQTLFKRQLSVPLLDMEKTFEELQEWASTDELDPNVNLGYKKALTKLKKIMQYEEAVMSAEASSECAYKDYLEFELKEGEPARIQCLYERAIVDNCLSPSLWEQYANYINSQLKIPMVVLLVYDRAIRNCPWSVKLWQGYIRALERYKEPRDKIKEVAERALASGFTSAGEYRELWLTYLEYLRRQIDWTQDHVEELEILRTAFEKAHQHLMDGFGFEGDPNCSILQYWARMEGRQCKNIERSREIWNQIINLGHGNCAQMWLEQVTLERACGDAKHARRIFGRGLMAASDWPELVGEAWLQFEKDEGNLDQYETAQSKFESRMKVIQEVRQKEEDQNKLNEQTESSVRVTKKRSVDPSTSPSATKHPKKRKLDNANGRAGKKSSTAKVDSDGFQVPVAPATKKRSPKSKDEPRKKKPKKSAEKSTPVVVEDSDRDKRSVFLSNLSFEVEEAEIREFFSLVGKVEDVRLVYDHHGRSRGFCYVEFSDTEIALQALKKDRELLKGRPLFVSKCEDKTQRAAKKQNFKYSEKIEKSKLFVRGLPFSMTQQAIGNLFKAYGDVKDARLVTYRNGNSKGFAFVEFSDEVTAAHAQSQMDGVTVDGHTLSVAISNPSEGKRTGSNADNLFGGSGEQFGQRTRGRTQISLLPRSLMKASKVATTTTPSSVNGSAEETSSITPKPLSNEEFRKLLLNK